MHAFDRRTDTNKRGWITQTYKVAQHIHNAMTVLKLLPMT